VARLHYFLAERSIVERHQDRLDPRTEGLDGDFGRHLSERRELRPPESADERLVRAVAALRRSSARLFRHGDRRRELDPLPRDLELQAAGDRVLRVERERGFQRFRRGIELPDRHATARETRPRTGVVRSDLRQLLVGALRVGSEIAAPGEIDRLLFESLSGIHTSSYLLTFFSRLRIQ
jgi:hypothetical protein